MTQKEKIPDPMLTDIGDLREETVSFIEKFEPDKSMSLIDFIENFLPNIVWMSERQMELKKKYRGKRMFIFHTGGHSRNEEIIKAMKLNPHFMLFFMRLVKWETGGHYYFEITV
jgi:hypothetical protein